MKKILIAMLAALLLLLVACQPGQTAAEAYLANHSQQEICDYFDQAKLLFCDFTEPGEIPPDNLYRFTMFQAKDSWFNEEDRQFYIPIADIYAILDDYLAEYSLPEEWFAEELAAEYDPENRRLVCGAIGMGTGCTAYDFVTAEAIDADNLRVTLLQYCSDPEVSTATDNVYITARIVDGQPRFTSCETVANQ